MIRQRSPIFARAQRRRELAPLLAGTVSLFVACFSEGGPAAGGRAGVSGRGGAGGADARGGTGFGADAGFGTIPEAGDGGQGGPIDGETFSCDDAAGEPLPARRAITSPDGNDGGGDEIIAVTKAALFREFERQTCGNSGCHGGGNEPLLESPDSFKMTLESFDERPNLGTQALERILSSDPDEVMPPETPNGDGSMRGPNDPVRILGERLLAWQEAGFPEVFEVTRGGAPVNPDLPEDPYLLSPGLAAKLTNIGNCVPQKPSVLTLADDEMAEKDELFASIASSNDLPDTLFETDLVSLDSTVLARRRVYSYAPTYTLFSDNAGKMRHLRVPAGEVIRYDPETKDFHIPDNTRFYKTFLKQVRDEDGNVGWRKMETRLIVVRNDERLPNGGFRTRALRAAYAWDRKETMARRVTDPFRNAEPAADRLCAYIIDESLSRDPETNPISDEISENCTYMTAAELGDPSSGKIRHYAIPSTERCDQCHMGSSSHSYILGFSPWQVDRRAAGEGGVYEDPMGDELGQLARLIDYGVITGIEPGEAKLEESQGRRKPRNDFELKAQGYMIGNCAFCHNPNGFPVVQNPVLREFNLYPDEDEGGIFQFSLERYSPRAKGGITQEVRFPYITPDFGDSNVGLLTGEDLKVVQVPPNEPPVVDADQTPPPVDWDPSGAFTFLAPWRSLIWRNVSTPFTYEEDGTIFIHMPRNAPGHDCRAQKIMADWMLSIPTVPKPGPVLEIARENDQPVVEATRRSVTTRVYDEALELAAERVEQFRNSIPGQQCPPDDDIVDPKVVLSPILDGTASKARQTPLDDGIYSSPRLRSGLNYSLLDSVPDHAHWVPTDLSDPPGRWVPRRANWKDVVVTREVPVDTRLGAVIDDLQKVRVTPEFRDFALEPVPMGTWEAQCQGRTETAGSPTVGELKRDDASFRRWMNSQVFAREPRVTETLRVHYQSRGEAVFRAICQNCHGREADSRSPLAATIVEVTGGRTRVANFVDGLFGPQSAPGAFAEDEFLVGAGATPADWQARYLLFMGLGGTQAEIPKIVLDLVATSPFYGAGVTAPGAKNANMLGSAEQLCFSVLGAMRDLLPRGVTLAAADLMPSLRMRFNGQFVAGSAHYELWESLCTHGNEPVVQVCDPVRDECAGAPTNVNVPRATYRARDDSGSWIYPPDHPVGNQHGNVETGIREGNTSPWCVLARTDEERVAAHTWLSTQGLAPEGSVPFCPEALFAKVLGHQIHRLALDSAARDADPSVPFGNQDFSRRWMRKGAMNAGLAAYHYLSGLLKGETEPSLPFDFCRQ